MRLQYLGRILINGPCDERSNPRMWNVMTGKGTWPDRGTFCIQGLQELGLIKTNASESLRDSKA